MAKHHSVKWSHHQVIFLTFNVEIVQIYPHSQTPQYHMTHHQIILLKFDFEIVQIYLIAKHQSVFVGWIIFATWTKIKPIPKHWF
jgi:hypothetical protein